MIYSGISEDKMTIVRKIAKLKSKLRATDYVTDKLTAAITLYIIDGDKFKVIELYEEYKDLITERQQYRDEINELEAQLKAL